MPKVKLADGHRHHVSIATGPAAKHGMLIRPRHRKQRRRIRFLRRGQFT